MKKEARSQKPEARMGNENGFPFRLLQEPEAGMGNENGSPFRLLASGFWLPF